MGSLIKLIDKILLPFFVFLSISSPLIDTQAIFPRHIYPDVLVDIKQFYIREFGDFLLDKPPSFFRGLIWLQLLFQLPLCLSNLYGLLGSKSWYSTTCLIYGVSIFTSVVTILFEYVGFGKESHRAMVLHIPFLGLGVLATLRGLMPYSTKTASITTKGSVIAKKKRT